eukprot:gene35328-52800_t
MRLGLRDHACKCQAHIVWCRALLGDADAALRHAERVKHDAGALTQTGQRVGVAVALERAVAVLRAQQQPPGGAARGRQRKARQKHALTQGAEDLLALPFIAAEISLAGDSFRF